MSLDEVFADNVQPCLSRLAEACQDLTCIIVRWQATRWQHHGCQHQADSVALSKPAQAGKDGYWQSWASRLQAYLRANDSQLDHNSLVDAHPQRSACVQSHHIVCWR